MRVHCLSLQNWQPSWTAAKLVAPQSISRLVLMKRQGTITEAFRSRVVKKPTPSNDEQNGTLLVASAIVAAPASDSTECVAQPAQAPPDGTAKPAMTSAPAAPAKSSLVNLLTDPGWKEVLRPELSKPYFKALDSFMTNQWAANVSIWPPKERVFYALNTCSPTQVRVVILGQDPYPTAGNAMGLSFSVPPGTAIPASLKNIFKELQADMGCASFMSGSLEGWARQGVLLLNAVLTVEQGKSNSHKKAGWLQFTTAVITAVNQLPPGVVFLLWGKDAEEKRRLVDESRHHVLVAAHPSPLARGAFFGCKHFSKANQLLAKSGRPPIDWCSSS